MNKGERAVHEVAQGKRSARGVVRGPIEGCIHHSAMNSLGKEQAVERCNKAREELRRLHGIEAAARSLIQMVDDRPDGAEVDYAIQELMESIGGG